MHWFDGTIVEAISTSKCKELVFIVFITDDSDAANTTLTTLQMTSQLDGRSVAIKIGKDSEQFRQFSQILKEIFLRGDFPDPVLVLPSLYFINPENGAPIEVLSGAVTAEMLYAKLENILKISLQPEASNSSAISANSSATASCLSTEAPSDTGPAYDEAKTEGNTEIIADNDGKTIEELKNEAEAVVSEKETDHCQVSIDLGTSDAKSDRVNASAEALLSLSLEERIARAKALAEAKQKQRQEEIKQKEINDEITRRQMGKEMRRIKRDQEEKEMKDIANERKRQREEDRLARERVRAQIAEDRAERERQEALRRGDMPRSESPLQSAPAPPPTRATDGVRICRIKLRLPDGTITLAQFPETAPLSAVRDHLLSDSTRASLPLSFRLVSSLHQRPYNEDDISCTLEQLGLAPSAFIIVMANNKGSGATNGVVAQAGGLVSTLLWLVSLPVTALLGLLRSLLSGSSAPARPASPPTPVRTPSQGDDVSSRRSVRPKTAYGTRSETRLRRDGNIHRLGNENRDDDDENNTWNGNSTQQM